MTDYQRVLERPTAAGSVPFQYGELIWYRQITNGAGASTLVPGMFERYMNVRAAVVLAGAVDGLGRVRRVHVLPANVYRRLEGDEVAP